MKNKVLFGTILGVLVVLIAVVVTFLVMRDSDTKEEPTTTSRDSVQKQGNGSAENDKLAIKHLGIELAAYDPTTQTVGDIKFTNIKLEQNRLFFDYGYEVPASSAGPAKRNPQPTFIVPLGTKVHSIVDGVVVNIPKLYSNDYSIHVASSPESNIIYEMEHVINVTVQVGDEVKAGDVVAEVSDYDTRNTPGFGLVEIGILEGGNPPKHICTFEYLDPEFKKEVDAELTSLYEAWNEYKGETIYDTSKLAMPGCLTTEKIEG